MSTQQRVDFRDARPDPPVGAAANGNRLGERLPRPPGRRRPGLALLAALLIVLGGAIAGLLALRIDQRQPVLVARGDILVGQQISRSDLAVAHIAAEGLSSVPASAADQVVGKYATSSIPAGRLIDGKMLGTSGLLTTGKAAVGIALQPGRYPASGLEPGDVVQLVRTVEGGVGKLLTTAATISSVKVPGDDSFTASGGNALTVTVIVDQRLATEIAGASAADQVSVVLLRRGGGT